MNLPKLVSISLNSCLASVIHPRWHWGTKISSFELSPDSTYNERLAHEYLNLGTVPGTGIRIAPATRIISFLFRMMMTISFPTRKDLSHWYDCCSTDTFFCPQRIKTLPAFQYQQTVVLYGHVKIFTYDVAKCHY